MTTASAAPSTSSSRIPTLERPTSVTRSPPDDAGREELTGHPFGLDDDKLHEECGVFGVFGHQDAAALTALGLHALQHRGQEAAGIVSFDGRSFHHERHFGVVGDNFTRRAVIDRLPGDRAIGHVRYSTRGGPMESNIQPLFAGFSGGGFAVAHNGNITNALALQNTLQRRGSIFQSTSDTEVILHLIATSRHERLVDRIIDALNEIEGAWSLVCLSSKKMIGCRDPLGVRPLVLGDLDGSPILASETCALDIIGARFVRDVEPGEMVIVTPQGIESRRPFQALKPRFCIFEYVYFARPDSVVDGRGVYEVRKRIGAELAREAMAPADLVVPVPDSGTPAAIGFAEAAGIPFDLGIIRNHYVGRTFIEPSDAIRHMGVKLKHNANRDILEGKRVVLVDDSIVRGTTSSKIVQMVRDAGAAEVHMRIASPPTSHSCFYGVDTPETSKLIASRMSVEEMEDFIKVDSLRFLSIDGLYRAVGEARRDPDIPQYCDACFTGAYPTRLVDLEANGGEKPEALKSDRLTLLTGTA
ncbi:MAG: amidophosphoribosyltransferase [Bauldia sp.]|nr:amidophosphoribosyltransferase [Bauldia sp.]